MNKSSGLTVPFAVCLLFALAACVGILYAWPPDFWRLAPAAVFLAVGQFTTLAIWLAVG